MDDVLAQIERQLLAAIRERVAARRARRRRLMLALAIGVALLALVSVASAISGHGPIAEVLGVESGDPTLGSVEEAPGAPRAVVRVRGDDGHRYTFAAFHATGGPIGERKASICFTQTRDDDKRIPSLACGGPARLAAELRRAGAIGGTYSAHGGQAGGLGITKTAAGLVPAGTRRVTLRRGDSRPVVAALSNAVPVSLGKPPRPARMRAFLAVASYDADGPAWLGGPTRETITVQLGDGSTKRLTFEDQPFFPSTAAAPRGRARTRMLMRFPARPAPWRALAYVGGDGTLCNSAAPPGERLDKPTLRQCSSPLAVVNALARYGAAVYFSNPNPRREREARSTAVFGLARADASAVTIVNQRGRRFEAKLSPPWATAVRRQGDLAGTRDGLRRRLERLPQRMRLRSYITSISLPPRPTAGGGLRLEVRLRDGTRLRTTAR
jgi:hypothetical protein